MAKIKIINYYYIFKLLTSNKFRLTVSFFEFFHDGLAPNL